MSTEKAEQIIARIKRERAASQPKPPAGSISGISGISDRGKGAGKTGPEDISGISGISDKGNEAKETKWGEPDLSILDDRRGDLPEFPIDVLASGCRDWIIRSAHGAGVTLAHVAVPLLGISSSLIGTARRARPTSAWTQPCTTWTAIVGFSGSGKTPGLDTVKRALAMIERTQKNKIADKQNAHDAKIEAAKAARSIWKKQIEEAAAGGKATPQLPPEAIIPAPFIAERLYVSDSTIERLSVLLGARPRGLLLISDELAGLFMNMSRYSNGSDRAFWLEAWNGGTFTVERMGREPLTVDHLLIGLVGGLQPDKLKRAFEGDHDGFYGRMLFAWPPEPAHRSLADDVSEVEPEIINALTRLVNLDAGEDQYGEFAPKAVPLTADALASFEAFRELAHRQRQLLDGREREWMAKSQAHALRLSGVLEFLGWAFVGGEEPKQISLQSVDAAVTLVRKYFWPHSRAALRQIGLSERHANARRVLRWLAARKHEEFSREDIRIHALTRSVDAEQTQAIIDGLTKSSWCREITQRTPAAGRPARRWAVNPALLSRVGNTGNTGNGSPALPGNTGNGVVA